MGINSLLKHLGPISETTSLRQLGGKTFAVDAYSWLHKSIFTCPEELCTNKPTKGYITYFRQRYEKLKQHNIHLYMVFDGHPLGAKMNTNLSRKEDRENNKVLAEQYILKGDLVKAREHYSRACPVTVHMAKSWIKFCIQNKIPYIVAPFEADSQMVYLEKLGLVDGIISEDSDLLIFGCKTLVTKLDLNSSSCVLIERKNFPLLDNDLDKKGNPKFPIGQLSQTDLYNLVCLSGCDYTPGIYLIGLLKAVRLLKENNFNMENSIRAVQTAYKQKLLKKPDTPNPIPETYFEDVVRAKICFAYMFVFDPLKEKVCTLNPLPENPFLESENFFEYMGPLVTKNGVRMTITHMNDIDHGIHKLISLGEIHQSTLETLLDRESQLIIDYKSEIADLKKKPNVGLSASSIDETERTFLRSDSLADYYTKELKFILPLRRSRTVDDGFDRKLESMIASRKLTNSSSVTSDNLASSVESHETSSKFFKRKRSVSKVELISSTFPTPEPAKDDFKPKTTSDDPINEESLEDNENNKEISFTNPNHLMIDFSEEKFSNLKVEEVEDIPLNISLNSNTDDMIEATINDKSAIIDRISKYTYKDGDTYEKSEIVKVTSKSNNKKSYSDDGFIAGQIIKSPEKMLEEAINLSASNSPLKKKRRNDPLNKGTNSKPQTLTATTDMKEEFSSFHVSSTYQPTPKSDSIDSIESLNKSIASLLQKYKYTEENKEVSTNKFMTASPKKSSKKGSRTLARSDGKKLSKKETEDEIQRLIFPEDSLFVKSKQK